MRESFYTIAGCPVSLAIVSDLHERPFEKALASLERNRPALICIPGDFLYGRPPIKDVKVREAGVLPFLEACAGLAPCFASLGNHEWMLTPEDFSLLKETGVQVLDNSFTTVTQGDARLVVGGLSSARVSEYRRLRSEGFERGKADVLTRGLGPETPPRLEWLDACCREDGYHILLCHHPEYYPHWLREREIELILSGHAHGGQIRLFGQGLYAPGQGLFPKLTSGVTDGRLVISRGLANRQLVPRVFNPTEIVYIHGS